MDFSSGSEVTHDDVSTGALAARTSKTVDAQAFDVQTAYDVAHQRRGRWFDPVLVDCLDAFRLDIKFWGTLRAADSLAALQGYEPPDRVVFADELRLDTVAEAFASFGTTPGFITEGGQRPSEK